jgi:hypothetical protein
MIRSIKEKLLKKSSFGRRNFLKLAGVSSLATFLLPVKTNSVHARNLLNRNWWYSRDIFSTADQEDKNVEYCIQHNVRKKTSEDGVIWSNLDNIWRKYQTRELSEDFMKWGCAERYFYYEGNLNPEPLPEDCPKPPGRKNGGIHHGTVATYGKWLGRGDSAFHLNNTVKGTALCPTRDTLKEVLPTLEQLKRDFPDANDRLPQYYEIMQGVFSDISNFDRTKLLTLELYTQSTRGTLYDAGIKETHTFGNMMANPICTLAFLQPEWPQPNYFDTDGAGGYNSFPYGVHFEVRAIPNVIHCWAPDLGNEYDFFNYENADDPDALFGYWVNFLHTFYHGGRANITTVVYHVIEQFNNTPGDPGRGIRDIPPM